MDGSRLAGCRPGSADADVLNTPMAAAFEATGHRGSARSWHVWHYRLGDPAGLAPVSSGGR